MKTNNPLRKLFLIALLTMSVAFISCKKSQVGPAGPAGEEGKAGAPGNANVKSMIFSVNNWKADSACKTYVYKYHTPELTDVVLESGAIMLYLGESSGDNKKQWRPMPLSQKEVNFTFEIELSTLQILVTESTGLMPKNPGTQLFKLVIIPPAS